MPCEIKARLAKQHAEAGANLDAARKRLLGRIGVSPKPEYLALLHEADLAWKKLKKAQYELDRHIREHHCDDSQASAS
jgi:hypothetical protein